MERIALLLQKLAVTLSQLNWQLVTAESCTGGLIASTITEIPGSSTWFERGFVTYSPLAKQELLDVPNELINTYGLVSEEVAAAMVQGALQHSAGHVALAVTGIAGPDGGTVKQPVGTVCFAWALRTGSPRTLKKCFQGTRHEIRSAACHDALQGVLTTLLLIS
jgi:nicotinamide-nucleotide amidase